MTAQRITTQARATTDAALATCLLKSGERALTEPDAFLLRNSRQNAEYGVSEDADRIQVLLRE